MGTTARNYQNQLLEDALVNEKSISLFLHSGVRIDGQVLSHDIYTVFMQSKDQQTLIYKHAITSIFPVFINRPKPSGNEEQQKESKS